MTLIAGLSMLQNGPMPSFFTEELVQKLLSIDIDVQPSVMQLRTGFAQLGLIEVDIHGFLLGGHHPISRGERRHL